MPVEAYCVRCKTKRKMVNPKSVVTRNGRQAQVGVCPVCGTKMFKMGQNETAT